MGILNLTPDSFYEKSRVLGEDPSILLRKVKEMVDSGAGMIDLGGYSTRPGAAEISVQEEIDRVIPAVALIAKHFPEVIISVDSFRSSVIRSSIEAGAHIANDVSGGNLDEMMFETVASLGVPYVLMHMRGTPATMNTLTDYNNVVEEVIVELQQKIIRLRSLGVADIIVDPGFGFAKTQAQNFELLKYLEAFHLLECPLLVGISRKRMIWQSLEISAPEALNGTTVLNTISLQKGAHILRVHDVKEAVEAKKLIALMQKGS